jgi:hypothetical protein
MTETGLYTSLSYDPKRVRVYTLEGEQTPRAEGKKASGLEKMI